MNNCAQLLVKCLENEGVEYVFGLPGEENLDLLDALKSSHIKFILTRHEQSAAFMAANYGRLTGKPGVVLTTLGPGATNLTTAAAYAYLGGMPMIIITGQKSLKQRLQGEFQIVDIVGMMKPITKSSRAIVTPSLVPSMVREAFKTAQAEKPGPVHLELAEDIADEQVDASTIEVTEIRRPTADTKALDSAAEMISKAKSPIIMIGADANRYRISESLNEFVGRTGIPFMTTQLGKSVLSNTHPQFIGTSILSTKDYIHCAVDRSDLIINIGHDPVEKPPFLMKDGGPKVIHINYSAAQTMQVYFPQLEVIGDIANSLALLAQKVEKNSSWDFDYYYRVKEVIANRNKVNADSESFPLMPQRIVEDMNRHLTDESIVSLDNGMYKLWFARGFESKSINSLLLDNALGTMGAGLPAAMVAKMVFPDRNVVAVCGDGGFMMNSQELETAIRLKLDLTVVILNDSGYGMIKWKQSGMGYEDFALDYGNPDFVKYAESYGAKGYRVESAEHFGKILNEIQGVPGVKLIDLPVDYSENDRVFTQELENLSCNL